MFIKQTVSNVKALKTAGFIFLSSESHTAFWDSVKLTMMMQGGRHYQDGIRENKEGRKGSTIFLEGLNSLKITDDLGWLKYSLEVES